MLLPSVEEYVALFDSFALGASLSTTMTSYTGCRDGFVKAFRSMYYTINWYVSVFGGTDVSNANFFKYVTNITATMSASTDFVSKCLTTAEDTTLSLKSYIEEFDDFLDYTIAFLMNLTGNILSFYTTFQQIMTASSTCDYTTIANKMGVLFKKLYSVAPTEGARLQPLDLTKTKFYKEANLIFLGFKAGLAKQAKLIRISREEEKVFQKRVETSADDIFVKFYRPQAKHSISDITSDMFDICL